MEVVIAPSAQAAAELAADAVEALVRARPHAVLGLATGSSPLALYDSLARRHLEHGLSFAGATAFLLDEYIGLPKGHPEAYHAVIMREFAGRVDLPASAVHAPPAGASDLTGAAHDFERSIRDSGGVDLQVLGIGTDGHLAFNEPGSSLASRTRIKTLTEQTRRDNARFFGGDAEVVPRHVLTQGLATILDARHLVLLAFGPAKGAAVTQMVEGPVSATWPATVLQHHPHVTVLLDEPAAAQLVRAEYYRQAHAGKPAWQSL